MAQVDLNHSAKLPSLEVHIPAGQSAAATSNPASFPAPPKGGSQTIASIAGKKQEVSIKFANPA